MIRKCKCCLKEFKQGYQQPKESLNRYYATLFCSVECQDKIKGNHLFCKNCGKQFYRSSRHIVCCSYDCIEKWNRTRKNKQNRKRGNLFSWFGARLKNQPKYEFGFKKPFHTKQLKEHLEKQFTSKMSWNNYGKYWHIDHLVPLSWCKTKEQALKIGWNLKNLRPITAKENMSKSNKYVGISKEKEIDTPKIIYL